MATPAAPRIAVVGSNMVDLVTYVTRMPVRGETIEAPSFEMGHGGKGANQAVAAARLGASVVMVTAVGDDMFADNTIRNFAALVRFGPRRHRAFNESVGDCLLIEIIPWKSYWIDDPGAVSHYSCRSASSGSIFVARCAGM